ncbi:MAG: hypothetical protein AAGC55_05765 [Myxococcota bacterium]
MRRATLSLLFLLPVAAIAESTVLIVEGLGGNETYATAFRDQTIAIETAVATLQPTPGVQLFRGEAASREAVLSYLSTLAETMSARDQLHVYLIGHGSFDDEEYKFNIPGPDLTDRDLLEAFDAIPSGNQIVVNTSSASGAAADVWQGDSRVVITATRSGVERHATRFGDYFAAALSDAAADVDKNEIVTAQEAFNFADRLVAESFESAGNLATEHARLDGERAARFSLARLTEARASANDARLVTLMEARDDIAARLESLRLSRDDRAPDEYQSELLGIMLELAEAEEAIERREAELTNR